MATEVFIHKMSEHMESARILRWLVREGDHVEKFQLILEVETDKVTAELEAPEAGILKGIRPGAVDGAQIPVGETIAFIAGPNESVPVLPPLGPAETESAAPVAPPPAPAASEGGPVRATPVARRMAKELGVDLSLVQGRGPEGRIREEDVRAYAEGLKAQPVPAPTAAPAPAHPAAPGPASADGEWLDLTTFQRVTGERMLESIKTAPQFALDLTVDMTNALWLREALTARAEAETGEHLSITAILVKAVAAALAHHPRANAYFANGRLQLHKQINVGVAVGNEEGLVVPVIRDADQKTLAQIARELKSFHDKAQSKRFSADDLSGSTCTISNLGMYGIDRFNAIINPPESAILAVGRVVKTPVGMPDDSIALRPLLGLTLTVDHRVMDGIQGARFLAEIKERLEKPYFML